VISSGIRLVNRCRRLGLLSEEAFDGRDNLGGSQERGGVSEKAGTADHAADRRPGSMDAR
jgi:hypothetical protein